MCVLCLLVIRSTKVLLNPRCKEGHREGGRIHTARNQPDPCVYPHTSIPHDDDSDVSKPTPPHIIPSLPNTSHWPQNASGRTTTLTTDMKSNERKLKSSDAPILIFHGRLKIADFSQKKFADSNFLFL